MAKRPREKGWFRFITVRSGVGKTWNSTVTYLFSAALEIGLKSIAQVCPIYSRYLLGASIRLRQKLPESPACLLPFLTKPLLESGRGRD